MGRIAAEFLVYGVVPVWKDPKNRTDSRPEVRWEACGGLVIVTLGCLGPNTSGLHRRRPRGAWLGRIAAEFLVYGVPKNAPGRDPAGRNGCLANSETQSEWDEHRSRLGLLSRETSSGRDSIVHRA